MQSEKSKLLWAGPEPKYEISYNRRVGFTLGPRIRSEVAFAGPAVGICMDAIYLTGAVSDLVAGATMRFPAITFDYSTGATDHGS